MLTTPAWHKAKAKAEARQRVSPRPKSKIFFEVEAKATMRGTLEIKIMLMVYSEPSAGNWHVCDLLVRVKDVINIEDII